MKKIVVSTNCACVDVFVEKGEIRPGGEALNFCGNCCQDLDLDVYFMGAIGEDEYGQAILDKLKDYPIGRDYLKIEKGITANHKIWHTKEGDRYFKEGSWTDGVYGDYSLGEAEKAFLLKADVVHTSVNAPVLPRILKLKEQGAFFLAVDFNERREFESWERFMGKVDAFFISGSEDIMEKLMEWSRRFDTIFIATLAEKGSVAFWKGERYECAAEPVEKVVDTTGAGDSYQAGFLSSYIKNRDLKKAMEAGSRQAAQNISHLGGF